MTKDELVNQALFDAACVTVQAGHQQNGDTPPQTLNRLFRKHLDNHKQEIADAPPTLTSSNANAGVECWTKPDLKKIAAEPREKVPPKRNSPPVVIVRYRGRDCLIDGGHRIHAWHVAGDTGNHPVFVLTVVE